MSAILKSVEPRARRKRNRLVCLPENAAGDAKRDIVQSWAGTTPRRAEGSQADLGSRGRTRPIFPTVAAHRGVKHGLTVQDLYISLRNLSINQIKVEALVSNHFHAFDQESPSVPIHNPKGDCVHLIFVLHRIEGWEGVSQKKISLPLLLVELIIKRINSRCSRGGGGPSTERTNPFYLAV